MLVSARKEMERLASIARETLAPHRGSSERVLIHASELLDASMEPFQRQLDRTRVRLVRHYRSDALIEANPGELRQVFTNLVSNAIDAMPHGGSLELEIARDGQDVKLIFADTGAGIPADKLDEIFDPFVTTKGEKGLGIGLWISRSIVEKSGGHIEVQSSVEGERHGTRFTITLPAAPGKRNSSPNKVHRIS
jgi:signal transduction histidine kinase